MLFRGESLVFLNVTFLWRRTLVKRNKWEISGTKGATLLQNAVNREQSQESIHCTSRDSIVPYLVYLR